MAASLYFAQILASFEKAAPRSHTPSFHLDREGDNWRVYDGEKSLALFMPMGLDIWSFSPFEPDEKFNIEAPGKVVDLHTLHNTFINFGMTGWPPHWSSQGDPAERLVWNWLEPRGEQLMARIGIEFPDGETGSWLLRVRYDPTWGRYRYSCDIEVRKFDCGPMEVFNLMTAGALADCPENRRWTHSIWENADGEARRIVHSNALFQCTDYANGPTNDETGPWRWRNVGYPQAWVGYAAHESFNPIVLIHRANVPMRLGTCSQLFDEHICWSTAGQDNLDENGFFRYRMSVEVANLDASLARELLEVAKDPVRPSQWRNERIALPFYRNRDNRFDTAVCPWQPEECPILVIPGADDGAIAWDREVGHADNSSIRLRATRLTERRELFPTGAVCRVRPRHRYRLTGWIKSREVARFARLELAAFEYSYPNVTDVAASVSVTGTADWTCVTAELENNDAVYVLPKLVLYGPGTAWFDDVGLEEIS